MVYFLGDQVPSFPGRDKRLRMAERATSEQGNQKGIFGLHWVRKAVHSEPFSEQMYCKFSFSSQNTLWLSTPGHSTLKTPKLHTVIDQNHLVIRAWQIRGGENRKLCLQGSCELCKAFSTFGSNCMYIQTSVLLTTGSSYGSSWASIVNSDWQNLSRLW